MPKEYPWLDEFNIDCGSLLSCATIQIMRAGDEYVIAHCSPRRIHLDTCWTGECALDIATPRQYQSELAA